MGTASVSLWPKGASHTAQRVDIRGDSPPGTIKKAPGIIKDPSGTIYGSLDENAMEWGITSNSAGGRKTKARSAQAIGIGMILVLKNIAMFTPRRGVLYFNITSKNIECVLSARMEIPPPLLGALKKIEVQEKHEDEMTITELYEARVQREAERLRVLNYIKRTSE